MRVPSSQKQAEKQDSKPPVKRSNSILKRFFGSSSDKQKLKITTLQPQVVKLANPKYGAMKVQLSNVFNN